MIPKARNWRVNYWIAGKKIDTVVIRTVNKKFAEYFAFRANYKAFVDADKVTISRTRDPV